MGVHRRCLQEDQDWQDCEQEGQRPLQGRSRPLGCSSPEGPQGFEHQGFLSYQEGYSISILPKMANAMKAMKAMSKKPISAKLARRHVFAGKISKTKTGYTAA